MRAVVLRGPNQYGPEEIPKPEIASDEILLEMKAATICGTDMRIFTGKKTKGVRYPSVVGHEICGVIAEVGADVEGFSVGEKIAVANVVPCHHCAACLHGRENACTNRKAIGYEFNGGFEEYVRIPSIVIQNGNLVKLPDTVSYAAGAQIEPLACCIRGMKNAGTGFNDDVLILGAGPIGLFHLQLSHIAGARKVILSEPNAERRKIALELGADVVVDPTHEDLAEVVNRETDGLGVDVLLTTIGVPSLINSLMKMVKRGGTMTLFAGFAGTGETTVELNTVHYNEININGSTAYKLEDYLAAAEMVKTGRINLDRTATHFYKIEQFKEAFETACNGSGLKVVIEP